MRCRAFVTIPLATALVAFSAPAALAKDDAPCATPPVHVAWTSQLVQHCPTTSPLANGIPVYKAVRANPSGSTPPPGDGWIHGSTVDFICQKKFPTAEYFHPRGWWNYW